MSFSIVIPDVVSELDPAPFELDWQRVPRYPWVSQIGSNEAHIATKKVIHYQIASGHICGGLATIISTGHYRNATNLSISEISFVF